VSDCEEDDNPNQNTASESAMKKIVIAFTFAALVTFGAYAQAGHVRGPQVGNARCEAYGSVTYHETFRGGEMAEFAIHGDGDTDLDLFVYDMDGRLIARVVGVTDRELVRWYVPQTATYRIEVNNIGNVWTRYGVGTN
jgi:hypothetical protein